MAWSEKYNKTDVGKVPQFHYDTDRTYSDLWDEAVQAAGIAIPPAFDHKTVDTVVAAHGITPYQRRTSRSPHSIKWCIPAEVSAWVVRGLTNHLTGAYVR